MRSGWKKTNRSTEGRVFLASPNDYENAKEGGWDVSHVLACFRNCRNSCREIGRAPFLLPSRGDRLLISIEQCENLIGCCSSKKNV
ncbi:hypothetical protein TNIN_157861 [Trichonephila inaurata madagascariensis]|uniref:Uncharacterized protein n=1 Tax=Trichonephila inaurata madagascariensis TaxID=2747483 RepID=A0A8X6YTU4_9ARAC|nr:hypothetical protein TNIN_157861 [Trichonephila inaurata madagascariensis]